MVITNKKTLKKMNDLGLIQWPVRGGSRFSYVDNAVNEDGSEKSSFFEYKGKKYCLKYVSGCFFPYVYELNN